jgi:peptidyl-tRNA hydrolase
MTGKADFTEQEWDLVRSAPVSAGMIVITAEHGGMMRETFAMAKGYSEARAQHGKSQLLDELVTSKPERDHARPHSFDELKRHGLDTVRQAIALLEVKAQPNEVEEYKGFILALVDRVAKRHEEQGAAISPNEQAAIDEIAGALGTTPA